MNQLITVIVPVYNTEEYLGDCLNSVMAQTYKNLEILIINDGSDETCRQTIEQFAKKDMRIKVYHFDQRHGVGVARNFGLEKASGDYVYFLDSDDFIADNTLELLLENIGDHPMITGKIKSIKKMPEVLPQHNNKKKLIVYTKKRKKVYNNQSALHRLISMEMIEEYRLRFFENVECFADLSFIVPAMFHLEEALYLDHCLYFFRTRNDPVSNPSLLQWGNEQVVNDFIKVYKTLKDEFKITTDTVMSNEHEKTIEDMMNDNYQRSKYIGSFLDSHFMNFYRKNIILHFEDGRNISPLFPDLADAADKLDQSTVDNSPLIVRRELKVLREGYENKYVKFIYQHQGLRKVKKALKGKRELYIQLYRSFFIKMPLKENTVVFESFLAKSYSDNPKYIYQYMLENELPYKYVWIFDSKKEDIPGNPKQVKRFSLGYYYYLARSGYWISNSRMPKHLDKREETIYLQTWHGTPLKRLVFDMEDVHSANPKYKADFYQQSRRWDYLISPNQYSSNVFRGAFKYDGEMLEYGYPRNDILYNKNNPETINALKQRLGVPLDKKVILYAPTWRDDQFYARGKYKFDLQLDLAQMKEQLSNDYVVILRMHYFIANKMNLSDLEDFAFDVSKYNDVAELYLISDLLITDYSSVFFDYANLQRPILFYTYDLEKYQGQLRGFYIDMENDVPGPLLKTTDEIINAIEHIDDVQEQFASKYDAFYQKFCKWDDGRASEQVVNHVFGDEMSTNQTLGEPASLDQRQKEETSI